MFEEQARAPDRRQQGHADPAARGPRPFQAGQRFRQPRRRRRDDPRRGRAGARRSSSEDALIAHRRRRIRGAGGDGRTHRHARAPPAGQHRAPAGGPAGTEPGTTASIGLATSQAPHPAFDEMRRKPTPPVSRPGTRRQPFRSPRPPIPTRSASAPRDALGHRRAREALDQRRRAVVPADRRPAQPGPPQSHFSADALAGQRRHAAPPVELVAAAERYRLGLRLDRYVLDATLTWLEQHPEAAAQVEQCSINIGGNHPGRRGFLATTCRLARGPLRPEQLCLEITETSVVRDMTRARCFIGRMRPSAAASRWTTSAPVSARSATARPRRGITSRSTAASCATSTTAATTAAACPKRWRARSPRDRPRARQARGGRAGRDRTSCSSTARPRRGLRAGLRVSSARSRSMNSSPGQRPRASPRAMRSASSSSAAGW